MSMQDDGYGDYTEHVVPDYTTSVRQAHDLIEDPDVLIFYENSQVDAINISPAGVFALLTLADGDQVEVLSDATVYATRQSAWDANGDQEQ